MCSYKLCFWYSGILKRKLERDISINVTEDKSVLAGIIVKFGTLTLDGSLLNMITEKGVEVKEKIEKGLLEKDKKAQAPDKAPAQQKDAS